MKLDPTFLKTRPAVAATCALLLTGCLAGCGGGDDTDTASPTSPLPPATPASLELSGSVGDGPIVGADMRVVASDGTELASFQSDGSASYSVSMDAEGIELPLLVTATGGTDLVTNGVPDFGLEAATTAVSGNVTVNVNPFTTIALAVARGLDGGLSSANLATAESIVDDELQFGLSTFVAGSVTGTPVSAENVAEMVRASEAVSEVIRRVRDEMRLAGAGMTGDDVVAALGADLIDGVLDGRGGSDTDPRVAALTTLVSTEVLIETMRGELRVNGTDAMDALRSAIGQVSPGQASPTLDQLTVTEEMLTSAKTGIVAAYELTGSAQLAASLETLEQLSEGMDTTMVWSLLTMPTTSYLEESKAEIRGGGRTKAERVNGVARGRKTRIEQGNRAPVIVGDPPNSVAVGAAYSFAPEADDADGDPLSYAIENQPSWTAFDSATGQLSGTPGMENVGTHAAIVISASDAEFTASLAAFSITVNAINGAPVISGDPSASIVVGSTYSFTPAASDPDNDTLSFTGINLPSWASVDSATGELSGTPQAGDVGTHSGIRIRVSDGQANATLPAFAIEIMAATPVSATLTWVLPTQNEDGTMLTDLQSFRIYWWFNGAAAPESETLVDANLSTYTINNLLPGDYEFVVTAVNADGVESGYSNTAVATL